MSSRVNQWRTSETGKIRIELRPRPKTPAEVCPYGAKLTCDHNTGLWRIAECNWEF